MLVGLRWGKRDKLVQLSFVSCSYSFCVMKGVVLRTLKDGVRQGYARLKERKAKSLEAALVN